MLLSHTNTITMGDIRAPSMDWSHPDRASMQCSKHNMMMMMMIASHRSHTIEDLKSAFPQSFDTLGKIREEYHLTVDPTVAPVVHPCR